MYRPSAEEWVNTAEILYRQVRTSAPEWGDAVQDAIVKYFESDTGLDYDPGRVPLATFLLGVARRLVQDGRKREARRAEIGGRIAPFARSSGLGGVEAGNAEAVDPRPQYDAALYAGQIKDQLRAADASGELSDVASGIEACGGEPDENRLIAERFQTTAGRVNNWKKRLRRFGKRYERPK